MLEPIWINGKNYGFPTLMDVFNDGFKEGYKQAKKDLKHSK